MVSRIHAELAKKDLLPGEHLVDSGYVTVTNLVHARADAGVDLVGPTMKTHWYQAETGYDLTDFCIDWDAEQVTCPQGHVNSSWMPVQEAGKMLIKIKFSQSDCKVCPSQSLCTGTTRRSLTLSPKEQMQALFAVFTLNKKSTTPSPKVTLQNQTSSKEMLITIW